MQQVDRSTPPTPPRDELIHGAGDLLAGRGHGPALLPVLIARRDEVIRAAASFHAETEDNPDAPQLPARAVGVQFEAYLEALAALERALLAPELAGLDQALAGLVTAQGHLQQATRAYQAAWLTSGATPYPLLNLLHRLRALLEDPARDACQASIWTAGVLRRASEELSRDPRLSDLSQALGHAATWASEADLSNPTARSRAVAEITRVIEALEACLVQEWAPPPPPRSWIEAVLLAGGMLLEGRATAQLLEEALQALESELSQSRLRLDEAATLTRDGSALVLDEVARTRGLLQELEGALWATRAALGGGVGLEGALSRIEAVGRELERAAETLARADEIQARVPCPRCAHQNPPESRICSACAGQLPRLAAPERLELPTSDRVRSTHLLELLTAAERFQRGELSAEEFEGFLDWGQELTSTARQAVAALPTSEDEADTLPLQQLEAGLSQFEQGLADLAAYLHGGGPELFSAGTRRLLSGGQTLEAVRAQGGQG